MWYVDKFITEFIVYEFGTHFFLAKDELISNLSFYPLGYKQNKFLFWLIKCQHISELGAEVRNHINGHFDLDQSEITNTLFLK